MWAASYNSGGSILDFLQDVKLCFTTAINSFKQDSRDVAVDGIRKSVQVQSKI